LTRPSRPPRDLTRSESSARDSAAPRFSGLGRSDAPQWQNCARTFVQIATNRMMCRVAEPRALGTVGSITEPGFPAVQLAAETRFVDCRESMRVPVLRPRSGARQFLRSTAQRTDHPTNFLAVAIRARARNYVTTGCGSAALTISSLTGERSRMRPCVALRARGRPTCSG